MIKRHPQSALAIRIIFSDAQGQGEFHAVLEYLSELTEDIFQNAIIGNRTEKEIIIIVFDEVDGIDSRNQLVEKCGVLKERVSLILERSPRIGIGGCKQPQDLRDSLDESGRALKESSLSIIHYDDLDTDIDGESSIVMRATKYMNTNYARQISLESVSREVHVSPNYLSAMLRAETGRSYIAYVTEIRLDKAKELLKKSPLTVKAIGEQVGYSDPLYFSRIFKKHTGLTPADYRNKKIIHVLETK